MFANGAEIRLVDKPQSDTIRVALNRLRHCPSEIPDDDALNPTSSEEPDLDDKATTTVDETHTPNPTIDSTVDETHTPNPTIDSTKTSRGGLWQGRLRTRK